MSSALDIITDAMQDIGALATGQTLEPEDTALCLRRLNRRLGLWNASDGFKRFERMQTFAITTSAQSYTIGAATDTPTPTLIVATGRLPRKISKANWVLSAGSAPHLSYGIEIIEVERYGDLLLPDFSGLWPYGMYYQKTLPTGTLWPSPYPTDIVDSLQLFWPDQWEQIALATIATDLLLPEAAELALGLTLAEDLCLPFRTERSEQLKTSAAMARMAFMSQNTHSPILGTDGSAGRQ
jgi:hypothetical protein